MVGGPTDLDGLGYVPLFDFFFMMNLNSNAFERMVFVSMTSFLLLKRLLFLVSYIFQRLKRTIESQFTQVL